MVSRVGEVKETTRVERKMRREKSLEKLVWGREKGNKKEQPEENNKEWRGRREKWRLRRGEKAEGSIEWRGVYRNRRPRKKKREKKKKKRKRKRKRKRKNKNVLFVWGVKIRGGKKDRVKN
jgi:hypothetical protein